MQIEALQKYIPAEGKLLWVVEEAGKLSPAFIAPYAKRSTVLCNRVDLHQQYQKICPTILSDFSCDGTDFSAVIFYISKERLLSNCVIAASVQWLADKGELILLGQKNEGIKTYFSKLKPKSALKKHGDLYIGASFKPAVNHKEIEAYRQEHELSSDDGFSMLSKPGIFSWKKVDQGSAFLMASLQAEHTDFKDKTVLDLGCGNGYLALTAARFGAKKVTASDNNITAINLCRKNLERNSIIGEALIDDCAASLHTRFELILCNPPFHKGKNTVSELTERFVKAAKRLLAESGEAYFVVNAFIPLEKVAAPLFRNIHCIANNRQFKVLRLQHPL